MSNSRTKNTSVNMVIALSSQLLNLIINFVSRTFFVNILGADYLGVNGLFTNILTILSFAELGIGSAIVFSMYKPLALKDVQKTASLMAFYRKVYCIIGLIIAVVGCLLMPFLNLIIKEKPNVSENITLLYFLFLANTSVSYFFAYKKSIISADQKNYIVLIISLLVRFIQVAAQIVFLLLTRNYILYLLIQIFCTIFENIVASAIANKMYPFLKQKALPLEKSETKLLFKNTRALAVYKFGSVILNGTDNILISILIGVREIGLVSNYVLLSSSCSMILSKITEAFTASVGNLNAIGDEEKKYDIFNKIFLITAWIYGFATVGLIVIGKPFVSAWLGKEYVLDHLTSFGIFFGFYVCGVNYATYVYRTTAGYFIKGRFAPILAAILNILFSVLLFYPLGLAGIFIATPIARILTIGIVDPILIYRNTFKKSPWRYYFKYCSYLGLFAIICLISFFFVSFVSVGGWIGIVLKSLLVTLLFNGFMLLVFWRTTAFKEILHSLRNILKNH